MRIPKPCTRCGHKARDHSPRCNKRNGSWFGKCKKEGCNCLEYRPEIMIEVVNSWEHTVSI